MLGMQRYHGVRRVNVGRREVEGEALENGAQRHLRFQQREVLADADPGTASKWEEGGLMLGRVGNAIGEPLWIELACVFSPDAGIAVNEDDGQDEVHACRIFDATELHLLVSASAKYDYRWVQSEDLVQNHGYLQKPNRGQYH